MAPHEDEDDVPMIELAAFGEDTHTRTHTHRVTGDDEEEEEARAQSHCPTRVLDLNAEDDVALIGASDGDRNGQDTAPASVGIRARLLRRYIEFAVDRPGQTALAFLFAFVVLGVAGVLLFPVKGFMTNEGTPKGPVESLREDSYQLAQEATVFDPAMISLTYPTQTVRADRVSIVFWRADGASMLTEEAMATVRRVEQSIAAKDGFADVCWRLPSTAVHSLNTTRLDGPQHQYPDQPLEHLVTGTTNDLLHCLAESCSTALTACTVNAACANLLTIPALLAAARDGATPSLVEEAKVALTAAVAATPALLALLINVAQCSDTSCGTNFVAVIGGVCTPPLSLTTFLWATPNTGCSPAGTYTPSGLAAARSEFTIEGTLDILQGASTPTGTSTPRFCTPSTRGFGGGADSRQSLECSSHCIAPSPDNIMPFIASDYDRSTNPSSTHLRSTLWFGLPLRGYNNSEDRHAEQVRRLCPPIRPRL